MAHIWLRCEDKKYERRTPLIPAHAEILIALGHTVTVEESDMRAFALDAYVNAGCKIAKPFSWKNASADVYILGLKELDDTVSPIYHKHIYFSHSFQKQVTANNLLSRFKRGGGVIYDFEYIFGHDKKRIASFGYYAGVSACALAISAYFSLVKNENEILSQQYYISENELMKELTQISGRFNHEFKILILGGDGRCGRGIASVLKKLQVSYLSLGRKDAKNIEQVRSEMLKSDIVFNCISIDNQSPVFLRKEDLKIPRNLSIIVDVACDIEKPNNSLPIYNKKTSLLSPVSNISLDEKPLWMISIDNLASMVPVESSQQFSYCMLPCYIDMLNGVNNVYVNNAIAAYESAVKNLV